MRIKISFALPLMVSALTVSLTGCTPEIRCKNSDFNASSCNLYTAKDIPEAPLDQNVTFIGDSLFDYGEDYGAIPKYLIYRTQHNNEGVSAKTYYDLSVSGQRAKYIEESELPLLPLGVRTVIADAGGNNVLEICKAKSTSSDNNVTDISDDCWRAMIGETPDEPASGEKPENMQDGVINIVRKLAAINSIEHIIWVGQEYLPDDNVAKIVIDQANSINRQTCENEGAGKCTFVDNSQAWGDTPPQNYLLSDKTHLTTEGAAIIGENIWEALRNVGAYR